MESKLSALPAVHRVMSLTTMAAAVGTHGRTAVRAAVREELAAARAGAAASGAMPTVEAVAAGALARLARTTAPAYPAVINATGVLIHTNLGRAPRLAPELPHYLALEYDLDAGGRGERLAPVVDRLCRYFGSESAMVVTNNAAALVLLLAAHAAGREVIVSRGELIEIGGSFRLPEIMAAAGARLVEVGCTNRTHLHDYERAIGDQTAAILVAHRSNFTLGGFVATPDLTDLAALGRLAGIPVWVDQGSGCHLDLARYGVHGEQTVQQTLAAGAEAVLFSGDKLLASSQAGVVVGTTSAVAPMRRHPLRRALRPDKSALVALAATLDAYLAGRAEAVPLYALLATSPATLRSRARRLARTLTRAGHPAREVPSRALVGGGTTPDQTLESWAVALDAGAALAEKLRHGATPVVARLDEGRLLLDLRAVFPEQDPLLLGSVLAALTG